MLNEPSRRSWRYGRGDGPGQRERASRRTPLWAGSGNASRVSPARAARLPVDRSVQAPRKASARPGGGEAPARGGAGAGRGLWPPAGPDPGAAQWQGRWPLPERPGIPKCAGTPLWAGSGNAPRFPARAARCQPDRQVREERRPAPDPAGEKRPPGAGRALAGGFGPRLASGSVAAVAGAMAPAIEALTVPSPFRAGTGNATRVSPARAARWQPDRQVREKRRPAPDPAGGKRPPGAGRALAGGFGPPAGPDPGAALWQGRWPLPDRRGSAEEVPAIQREIHVGTTFQQPVTSSRSGCSPPVFMA